MKKLLVVVFILSLSVNVLADSTMTVKPDKEISLFCNGGFTQLDKNVYHCDDVLLPVDQPDNTIKVSAYTTVLIEGFSTIENDRLLTVKPIYKVFIPFVSK